MSIKALQDYTFVSKYARYNEEAGRRETWEEAVGRVQDMHLRRYPQLEEDIKWAFGHVKDKRVLGSQRALQFGGIGVEQNHARQFNCCVSFCDRLRFFQEAFWLLLCGSGVGFSVQKHHVGRLPRFSKKPGPTGDRPCKVHAIADSIEGWADALGVLLSSYFDDPVFPEYGDSYVRFDYSKIRPRGSKLRSSSGKAPGPEPLRKALELIRKLLDRCHVNGQRLRPIDAYDIVMHASDAVLSGGVRRSATLCLFSPDDQEMATAKTGNWFYDNPQRGRSNNSALLVRNKTSWLDFQKLMRSVCEFGEPGFLWADDTEFLVNPCCEIGFCPVDEDGNSGWAMCNLCEINGARLKSRADFEIAARAGAIIGTVQAGYTDFPYLGSISERIVRREALLGVSITGMMENPQIVFDPQIQRDMAELIKEVNDKVSRRAGINPAARSTCVKPGGTTSCILGTSSGIHPHHAKLYLRRVQANNLEEPFRFFAERNPLAVEDSLWSANRTDSVITFCIEVDDTAMTKTDVDAISLLDYVKQTQLNWVVPGTRRELCSQPWLTHNVSNTINVHEHEWDSVTKYIYDNRDFFCGISLIPMTGDKDYPQAPFCAVFTPEEVVKKYGAGSLMASGLIVDGLRVFNNLWLACDAAMGLGEELSPDGSKLTWEKIDWVRRARQFAKRYFGGDVRNMTFCLKDVHNWKLFCDLKREYRHVDYSEMRESSDETTPLAEVACAGGACMI